MDWRAARRALPLERKLMKSTVRCVSITKRAVPSSRPCPYYHNWGSEKSVSTFSEPNARIRPGGAASGREPFPEAPRGRENRESASSAAAGDQTQALRSQTPYGGRASQTAAQGDQVYGHAAPEALATPSSAGDGGSAQLWRLSAREADRRPRRRRPGSRLFRRTKGVPERALAEHAGRRGSHLGGRRASEGAESRRCVRQKPGRFPARQRGRMRGRE